MCLQEAGEYDYGLSYCVKTNMSSIHLFMTRLSVFSSTAIESPQCDKVPCIFHWGQWAEHSTGASGCWGPLSYDQGNQPGRNSCTSHRSHTYPGSSESSWFVVMKCCKHSPQESFKDTDLKGTIRSVLFFFLTHLNVQWFINIACSYLWFACCFNTLTQGLYRDLWQCVCFKWYTHMNWVWILYKVPILKKAARSETGLLPLLEIVLLYCFRLKGDVMVERSVDVEEKGLRL